MWNFSMQYELKQLIDLTAQRNYLATYDGKEYGPSTTSPRRSSSIQKDLHIAKMLQYA